MRRAALVILFALGATILAAPLAGAATDLYSNVGPGGSIGDRVSRYPLSHYALDSHFSAVKVHLNGMDTTGIPAMIAFFLAGLLWDVTAFAANAMIELFALAFSVDLINGSSATAGSGALAPIADTIHNLYAHTLGEPWMEVAIVAAGCWAMSRAMVQRRYAETVSALSMSLVYCLIALAIVARPDATIGAASRLTNEVSGAFLAVSAHGELTSGAQARRAASDELFEVLVLRPWVALNFGGTEHCIRVGTGSGDHDPESLPVRPLASNPREDAAARWQLSKEGELYAGAKQCVDNTLRYADHFLRYPLGSDDRDAEYEAINRADPSKVPDSDPAKATYKPAVVDKPATDAMEQGSQYQRLLLAIVIALGELGALLLLGSLAVSVLLAQMVVLLLACFAPVALVAGIVPGRGHDLFKNWAGHLATYLVRKAAYSLVLAVLLAALKALQDASSNLGWLLSFAMQSMFMWMIFLHRAKLAGTITAAVSGQHPERDTQLRKLLGVAYLTRRSVSPAQRRRNPQRSTPPTGGDGPPPPSHDDPPPSGPTPPPTGPSPTPVGGRPTGTPPDRDRGTPRDSGRAHATPAARRHMNEEGQRRTVAPSGRSHAATTVGGDGQHLHDAGPAGSEAKPDDRHAPSALADRPTDTPVASGRRPSDSTRPLGHALKDDNHPPPQALTEPAPPSLADELRGDRAGRRRPVGELVDEVDRLPGRRPVGELGDEVDRPANPDDEPKGPA